ncbi:putative glycoside hydrolase [Paenibacillus spongiae]|uniref:Glycoside hydrolase n=1 Tax=Paenibacillus spongiae TaxID=2909671 RepID=A0ABY5SA44_9BACL|nr:putative glycoside hydrolase [Paenibacillus spongiae]UVI30395.1 putative glycoside hydrolase [Paenibacillus spongiae]
MHKFRSLGKAILTGVTLLSIALVMNSCSSIERRSEVILPELKEPPQVNHKPASILQQKLSIKANTGRKQTFVIKQRNGEALRSQTAHPPRKGIHTPVRGIYVSGWIAGDRKRMSRLIQLVDETDLNAMVIDVKNDYGNLTYRSSLPEVKAIQADRNPLIGDIRSLLSTLRAKQIYTIGRVVVFKDPLYAQRLPSGALQKKTGGVWIDRKGKSWVDPYVRSVQEYNMKIAEEAARLGFDEIQFDYVRFPDHGPRLNEEVQFGHANGVSKAEIIGDFLRQARSRVHAAGALVSADVFGLVTSAKDDMGIGQSWQAISSTVDFISPMTYPSHYSNGMYGISQPDLHPSKVIRQAMIDANQRNGYLRKNGKPAAEIRPWLQSFTATWIHPHQHYGMNEIRLQIQAAKEQGVNQFLLWSSNCKYDYHS